MRLCEHPDFDQAIIAAREHFGRPGLTEQFIEAVGSRCRLRNAVRTLCYGAYPSWETVEAFFASMRDVL